MKNRPLQIKLTAEQVVELQDKIETTNLEPEVKKILSGLVQSCLWLQTKINNTKMTIAQVRSIFGLSTEKIKKKTKETNQSNTPSKNEDCSSKPNENNSIVSKKGGKNGADQYTGLPIKIIGHESLQPGDPCPECSIDNAKGRLYAFEPGIVVKLVGNPIITGKKYIINKLRCNLCNKIYIPEEYNNIKKIPKYEASCSVALALNKYQLGSAFTRIDKIQKMLGIPLPKSTQWDLINDLSFNIEPAFKALEFYAAQGNNFAYDDTPHKILDVPLFTKRKSTNTTAITVQYAEHEIRLFYTSTNIASENVAELLNNRIIDGDIVTMTDGAETNFTMAIPLNILSQMIICFCMTHCRRNFYDLLNSFEIECNFIIDCIRVIYRSERYCKEHKLSDLERLEYHRIHTKPTMDGLRVWLINQLKYISRKVEPNNELGEAIKYMLKNWKELTKFLIVPGVPIDNNHSERLIKCAILHRKNSLFYKTTRGAKVGSMIMSLIQTAQVNKVNPFDYLVALHSNYDLVKKNPRLWLPWNYHEQIELNNVA